MTASPRPSGVMQIALSAGDLEASTAFYRDALGLSLSMQFPGMAFFNCGGMRLMISASEAGKPDAPKPSDATVVYFKVEDLPAMRAALAAKGVPMFREPGRVARMPDHDLWLAFIRDPFGNLLGLMSEVRPPAAE